jgi:hypothetical protein
MHNGGETDETERKDGTGNLNYGWGTSIKSLCNSPRPTDEYNQLLREMQDLPAPDLQSCGSLPIRY